MKMKESLAVRSDREFSKSRSLIPQVEPSSTLTPTKAKFKKDCIRFCGHLLLLKPQTWLHDQL